MRRRLARRDFLKMAGAGAAGVLLLRTRGSTPIALRSDVSKPRDRGNQMNVILVIVDTLRKDHVGVYGNNWIQTPNLDALAKQSLRFTRAYPESIPTIPARRAIHTGLRTFPFRNWAPHKGDPVRLYGWQPIPEEQTTLAEILRSVGYKTLLVTDCYHQFKPAMNFGREFDVYRWIRGQESDSYQPYWLGEGRAKEYFKSDRGTKGKVYEEKLQQYLANTVQRKTEADWFAPQVFHAASELLEGVSQKQPFFLVVDSFDVHEPWDPPHQYVDLYDDTSYDELEPIIPLYGESNYLTERLLKRMRALYAGEVTLVDRWLGYFLDKANDLGLMENTVLLFLSDHGHALGEHGLLGKNTRGLWPELIDIPFLLRHPEGKGAGQTSEYFASTHDIAPTILGMLDLESPLPMDGENLALLLDGQEPTPRPYFTLGFDQYVWARDDRYVLICRNDGAEAQLYDSQTDPAQTQNIATDYPKIVKRLFKYVLKDAGNKPLPNYKV